MMNYKYYAPILGIFVAVLLISNIASTKIVQFGLFSFDGGTLLFPLSYIFSDILTEVYGYSRSRAVIWVGFISAILMSLVFLIVGMLPPADGWINQSSYDLILGQAPRIVCASIIAYFVGEFLNSYTLAKIKVWMNGRYLWVRTIGSTIIGEGADTSIFCLIAFYGVIPEYLLVAIIISNYVFKVGIEVLFTPITYKVCNFLKREENEDYYDYKTDYNPFKVKL